MEMTGKAMLVSDVAGQRLEVGDDQVDLPFVDEIVQPGQAPGGLRNRDQILRDGAFVADAIVDVGEAEAVNLGDVELGLQILQAAIERRDVDACVPGQRDARGLLWRGWSGLRLRRSLRRGCSPWD